MKSLLKSHMETDYWRSFLKYIYEYERKIEPSYNEGDNATIRDLSTACKLSSAHCITSC